MLHNTLTVAEWANLWEGICISTEGLQNNVLLNDWKIIFLMNKNKNMLKQLHISI